MRSRKLRSGHESWKAGLWNLSRDATQARPMPSCGVRPYVCPSVRVSVTFVYSVEMNKNICKKISLPGSHTILVFQHQTLQQYSDGDITPNGCVECRWVGTNRDYQRIAAGNGSITAKVQTTSATVYRAVYRTDGHASVNLCLPQPAACTTMMKKREQYRIYLYAAVNLKRNLRSMYCTIEATDTDGATSLRQQGYLLLLCARAVTAVSVQCLSRSCIVSKRLQI